jgi:hypothetical protein
VLDDYFITIDCRDLEPRHHLLPSGLIHSDDSQIARKQFKLSV